MNELDIEKLLPVCSRCEGTGTIRSAQQPPKQPQGGFGPYPTSTQMEICPDCHGKKYIPNEAAKVLIEFLKRVENGGFLKPGR